MQSLFFFGIKEGKALHLNQKNNEIPYPSFGLDPYLSLVPSSFTLEVINQKNLFSNFHTDISK
jgi:hypothetical protein